MIDIVRSLTWGDLWVIALLTMAVLQHAGTAGIHAAMGRDGRVHHRSIELRGALRGVVALAALLAPVVIMGAADALSSPARFDVYMRGGQAMLWLWTPITIIALVSFLVAQMSRWQVRSNVNSMVFSTLELLRPAVASVGIAVADVATGDVRVALTGGLAVIMALQVTRLTRRWWYAKPVTLEDLGAPVASTAEAT
jgi:hypothetical protein